MKKSETTSRRILDTVKELLKTRENLTIKEICDTAYINIAAVNYHFGDKDTLIVTAVNEIINDLKSQIVVLANKDFESTEQALYVFVELFYSFAAEYQGAIRYMLNSNSQEQSKHILEQLFSDKKFIDFVMSKMRLISSTQNNDELACKYVMILSTFIFPIMCQSAFLPNGNFSIENENFKRIYISQLLKILTE